MNALKVGWARNPQRRT